MQQACGALPQALLNQGTVTGQEVRAAPGGLCTGHVKLSSFARSMQMCLRVWLMILRLTCIGIGVRCGVRCFSNGDYCGSLC